MDIPTIDLKLDTVGPTAENRARIALEIADLCSRVGFFVVRNHGVPLDLMQEMREVARGFFLQPQEVKDRTALDGEVHRGYARINAEQIDPDGPQDFRETFLMGWERPDGTPLPRRIPLLGPNNWPEGQERLQRSMRAYYARIMETAQYLLSCFAVSIGQPPEFFRPMFRDPLTNLVLAYYPVLEGASGEAVLGCGEHTDYGLITLLMHDGVAGLQVRTRGGAWIDCSSDRDDLIVNVGDMMEFITGGLYVSNPHRVQVMRRQDRVSVPFFVQPDYDSLVKPVLEPIEAPDDRRRWKPRLGGAYIEERYAATFRA